MMNKLSHELLAELGLAAEHTRVIASVELEPGKVGQGLAGATRSPLDLSDHFVNAALRGVDSPTQLPFTVTKHQVESAVFRVEELPRPVLKTAGATVCRDDDVMLDARAGKYSAVLVETAEGRMIIHAGPAGVTVSVVGAEGDFDAWEKWESLPDHLSTALPSLSDLTGRCSCEPWLEARYVALASAASLVDHIAAVGVMVRLWMPLAKDRALADPASVVVAPWARKLAARELDAIERAAVERAGALRQQLDELATEDDLSPAAVRAFAYDRDALECHLNVLWLAGRGRQLGPELSATDDSAVTSLSALPASRELMNDPLLRAVHVSEPDEWWGHLCS